MPLAHSVLAAKYSMGVVQRPMSMTRTPAATRPRTNAADKAGPLSQGIVHGKTVTCPLHLSRFDLTTGVPLDPPAEEPLAVYPVSVDAEGWIVLEVE